MCGQERIRQIEIQSLEKLRRAAGRRLAPRRRLERQLGGGAVEAEDELGGMRLGRPPGREPAATGSREDQEAALLPGESERGLAFNLAVPQLEPGLLEPAKQVGRVADETELGEADELLGSPAASRKRSRVSPTTAAWPSRGNPSVPP